MRIALGSDESTELTSALARWLGERGHEVALFGALRPDGSDDWQAMASAVAREVVAGGAQSGIVCCWSGTGASIAANKVRGARAALCGDAKTATLAREWNDANVLALSLRATSSAAGVEILEAWFSGARTSNPRYRAMIDSLE